MPAVRKPRVEPRTAQSSRGRLGRWLFTGRFHVSDEGQAKEQTPLDILRHSTTHVMAKAVQRLFPGSMLGIGPPIENGFYYDIDVPSKQLSEDDFPSIEAEMRRIIKADEAFV